METKEYIIQEADKLFCQYGFKSVTMNDIAKHLGISKKTIYQHYKDKDELVNIIMAKNLESQTRIMKESLEKSENAVHEIFFAINCMSEILRNINPTIFYDLQKYHSKAWLMFREFRDKTLAETIKNNLKRGVKEGFFRKEINIDILTAMRLDQNDITFNQHQTYTLNKYSITEVMIEITEHFLYGICNNKGLEQTNKYKQLLNEQK
ncbi:MAG: TetR/AcrR family transcriptional regulator [Sphingobacteriaceae bacterium]|nr:TetR/AcrR family transcriptional regulator [Sphingobacteriaceae bacterium]